MDDSRSPDPPAEAPLTCYAQNFEDVLLWRALREVENGFYIDIGAQDPVIDSVSRAFYERGWRGVHVEPAPDYAARLRADRPDETVIEAAITEADGPLRFHVVADTGLSTADAAQAELYRQSGLQVTATEVTTLSLDSLLDRFADRPVHWLKVDVEGMEQTVLQSWRQASARPWIVVVESTLPRTQIDNRQGWEPLLLDKGYFPAYFDGVNRYYLAAGQQALAARFNAGPNCFDDFVLSESSHYSRAVFGRLQAVRHERDVAADEHQRRLNDLAAELAAGRADLAARLADLRHARSESAHFKAALDDLYKTHVAQAQSAQLQYEAYLTQLRVTQQQDQRLHNLAAEIAGLQGEIARLLASRSWRWTRPLRWCSDHLARRPSSLRRAPGRLWRLPAAAWVALRRGLQRLPGALLAGLRARPLLKRRLVRLVERVPGLAPRLRRRLHSLPPPPPPHLVPRPAGGGSRARQLRVRLAAAQRQGVGTRPE